MPAMVTGMEASGSNRPPPAPRRERMMITATSGNSLIATVNSDRPPAARAPIAFTAVRKTIAAMATATIASGPAIDGKTRDRAEAVAMASAAWLAQLEHQNAQATR